MVIHVDLGVVEVVRPIQVANEEQPTSMAEVELFLCLKDVGVEAYGRA